MPYIQLKRKNNVPRMLVWVPEPQIIDLTANMEIPVIDLSEDSDITRVSLTPTINSVDSSGSNMGPSIASSQWGLFPDDSFLMELADMDPAEIPRWNLGGGGDSQ